MHHIDFPGTIHIQPEHFINFRQDVTKSVAYHGFKRIALRGEKGQAHLTSPRESLTLGWRVHIIPPVCAG